MTPFNDPTTFQLFQGYDTFRSAGRSTAVQGKTTVATGPTQSYFAVCKDVESVRTALNISASVSASFGFGSVDAKTSFMHQLAITSTSVTIVVYTNIIDQILSGDTSPQLIGAPPADLKEFCAVYGDSFVSSLTLGREYYAAFVFRSESTNEQTAVTTALTNHSIIGTGSLDASFSLNFTKASSQVTTKYELRQNMSGVKNPAFPDQDHMIEFALNFGATTPGLPAVLNYEVTGYERVPGMLPLFQPAIDTRTLYAGTDLQPGLADRYAQLNVAANGANRLQVVYDRYGFKLDQQLRDRLAGINSDIATLAALFTSMAGDPSQTYSAPELPSVAYGYPTLDVMLTTGSQPGNTGGQAFNDINAGLVGSGSVLEKLSFRYHRHTHQIFATYALPDGTTTDYQYGWDTNGDLTPALVLQPGELISNVSVVAIDHVHQVLVSTTFGNLLAAPPKLILPGPMTTVFAADDDHAFAGFAGTVDTNSGDTNGILASLAVVSANFRPANWSGDSAQATRPARRKPSTARPQAVA